MRALNLRGVSLGGTLLAVAVLSLLAFTLAGLCVTHLRLSGHQDRGVLASNAARSAISAAIAKVLVENDFGKNAKDDEEVRIRFGETEGFVTFNPANAEARNTLYSTNNLDGTEDAPGAEGRLVPSGTIHLVAVGRSGDTRRRIEAVLRVPPFPWAIASGGRVDTKNGVVVGCLPEGATLPVALEDLQPADIVANGTQSNAVFLGSQSFILGDVETPGQVVLGPSPVDIRGEVRSGSSPVKLPLLNPVDYDPEANGKAYFSLDAEEVVSELTGSARAGQNMTFSRRLTLDNAQLYVEGDLDLRAGVKGTGILVATGNITIQGGAQLEGTTELAVISGGRVQLRGTGGGAEGTVIRGLFYAQQGLDASELTLVGSLLTGNASTGITLDQVNVYYEEQPNTSVASTASFSEGTFQVGGVRPTETGPTERALVIRDFFEQDSTVLPNEFEPIYRIDLRPTGGDYPVLVTFLPGVIDLGFPPRELKNDQDRDLMVNQIFEKVLQKLPALQDRNHHAYSNAVQSLRNTIKRFSVAGDSEGGPTQPSISLVGDISRFLPMEDRLRVVSWVEQ